MSYPYPSAAEELNDLYAQEWQRLQFERAAADAGNAVRAEKIAAYLDVAPQLRVAPSLLLAFDASGIKPEDKEFADIAKRLSPYAVEKLQGKSKELDAQRAIDYINNGKVKLDNGDTFDGSKPGRGGFAGVWDDVYGGIKSTTRAVTDVPSILFEAGVNLAESPLLDPFGKKDGVSADQYDTFGALRHSFTGTTGYQDLFGGKGAGSGFFAAGDAKHAAYRVQRGLRGENKHGDLPTLGRDFAIAAAPVSRRLHIGQDMPLRWQTTWTEDDDERAYKMISGIADAYVAINLDPSNPLMSGTSKAVKARRAFDVASDARSGIGAMDGIRRWVHGPTVEQFKHSTGGRKLAEDIAIDTNPRRIAQKFSGQIEPDVALALSKTKDPTEVWGVLDDILGLNIRERPVVSPIAGVGGVGYRFGRRFENIRWLNKFPGHVLNVEDKHEFANELDSWLANAKVPTGMRDTAYRKVAEATSKANLYEAATWSFERTAEHLIREFGTDPQYAKQITRAWKNTWAETQRYNVDAVGQGVGISHVTAGGVAVDIGGPHLLSEMLNSALPLPSPKEIKLAAKSFSFDPKVSKVATDVLDFVFDDVWKPMQLMRLALPLRIIGEEQVRMAASGLDSAFRHPISYLASIIGSKDPEQLIKYGNDALGEEFASQARKPGAELMRALSGGGAKKLRDPSKVQTNFFRIVEDHEDDFHRAWAGEITQLAGDPLPRHIARDMTSGVPIDATKEWFWSGAGQKFRKEAMDFGPEWRTLLNDKNGAAHYIDTVVDRIKIKTADDSELLDAVATHKFRDGHLVDAHGSLHDDLIGHLETLKASGIGPKAVKGKAWISGKLPAGAAVIDRWDNAVTKTFDWLLGKRTNYLSRSPAFRQYYWREMERIIPFADAASVDEIIKNAEKAQLDPAVISRLMKRGAGNGKHSVKDLDLLAKKAGLDDTRKLLYDISEKGQISDSLRHVIPFAEAWREVVTRWAKLAAENPRVLRRAQQITQFVNDGGNGAFVKDPQSGDAVFVIPGSQWVTQHTAGVPMPFTASVQGLNLAAQGMPGFGPAIQMTADAILPDTPEMNEVRNFLAPYGSPLSGKAGLFETLFPGWANKFLTGGALMSSPEQQRMFASSVGSVMQYKASTGEYDLRDQEDRNRLINDSKKAARTLWFIRGATQFVSPSAPQFNDVAEDKDGKVIMAYVMTDDYRRMLLEDPYGASQKFLDKYGEDAFLFMQPKTVPKVYGLQPTTTFAKWAAKNSDIVRDYPNAYALIGPRSDDEDSFSYTEYQRQLATGDREALLKGGKALTRSAQDWIALAQHRVGAAIYDRYRSEVGITPNEAQREWLAAKREAIGKEFPGYNSGVADRYRLQYDSDQWRGVIAELRRAAGDDRLKDVKSVDALRIYMGYRDQALEAANQSGLATFATAKAARPLRDWLRAKAEAIVHEYPSFLPMWEELLSREGILSDPEKEVDE